MRKIQWLVTMMLGLLSVTAEMTNAAPDERIRVSIVDEPGYVRPALRPPALPAQASPRPIATVTVEPRADHASLVERLEVFGASR